MLLPVTYPPLIVVTVEVTAYRVKVSLVARVYRIAGQRVNRIMVVCFIGIRVTQVIL